MNPTRTKLQEDLELATGQPIAALILERLRRFRSIKGAAQDMGVSRGTLTLWAAQLGIDPEKEIARAILEAA